MSLRVNSEAPNFTAATTRGTINLHEWIGDGWAILFSHPKDFEQAKQKFPGGWTTVKPYLRMVAQPQG